MFPNGVSQVKLFRAEKLVSGLAGERDRWEASIVSLEEGTKNLPGDCLVAAAFLSYAGPFATQYREVMVNHVWVPEVSRFLQGLLAAQTQTLPSRLHSTAIDNTIHLFYLIQREHFTMNPPLFEVFLCERGV